MHHRVEALGLYSIEDSKRKQAAVDISWRVRVSRWNALLETKRDRRSSEVGRNLIVGGAVDREAKPEPLA